MSKTKLLADRDRDRDRDRYDIINKLLINSKKSFGPGRPRTLGVLKQYSLSLYAKYLHIYERAYELADREGKSFSEIINLALKEYVEGHYPGNPQPPLESFQPDGLKPVRLEALMLKKKAEKLLEGIESNKGAESYRERVKSKVLPPIIVKLSRLNLRLRSDEISKLVDRADEACFGGDSHA